MLRPSLKLAPCAALFLISLAIPAARATAQDGVISSGASASLGPGATFVHSFGIIFREGIEALLLCTALAAAAVRAGAARGPRAIWQGALAALLASVVTALLVDRVLHLAPTGREAIEGVTMLLAAAVLFYVSYWLVSKLEATRWIGYLRERVEGARSEWALAGVGFLAVYREGVETLLFYEALSGAGAALPIWAGLGTGLLVLTALGFAVLRFGLRLPVRPLFAVTGALLYTLAVVFAGQGVHELQEAGWITETEVGWVPRIGALGIYPTLETQAAQAVFVVLAALAAVVILRRRSRVTGPLRPAPVPAEQSTALR